MRGAEAKGRGEQTTSRGLSRDPVLPKGSPASCCFVEEVKPAARFYTVEVKGRDNMYQRPCPHPLQSQEGIQLSPKPFFISQKWETFGDRTKG